MKLALGTVQFGVDYGISNSEGKTPLDEVRRILDTCVEEGISCIDTAAQYGSSEEVLGNVLDGRTFNLITKTPSFNALEGMPSLCSAFAESLRKLKREHLYGLLFHDADTLISEFGDALFLQAVELKRQGVVGKVGVSVYHAEQIKTILRHFDIDIIQLPLSVFDQRLLGGGQLQKLKNRGVEIHTRSVFLQGLLMMSPHALPPYFSEIYSHLKLWHDELYTKKISPITASLGFVKGIREVDKIVVGVNNNKQLVDLVKAYNKECMLDYSRFSLNDEKYLDPRLWKL